MGNCESKSDVRRENNRICLGQKNEGLDRSIKIWERFRTCAWGNLIHTWYYFCTLRAESVWYYCIRVWMVTIILDLCDFLEAFKPTYILRPKTTRDLKEFFWANFTHFRQKAKKIFSIREQTDLNFGNQKLYVLSEDLYVKLRQQISMSANERFWSEIKRTDIQLWHKEDYY